MICPNVAQIFRKWEKKRLLIYYRHYVKIRFSSYFKHSSRYPRNSQSDLLFIPRNVWFLTGLYFKLGFGFCLGAFQSSCLSLGIFYLQTSQQLSSGVFAFLSLKLLDLQSLPIIYPRIIYLLAWCLMLVFIHRNDWLLTWSIAVFLWF